MENFKNKIKCISLKFSFGSGEEVKHIIFNICPKARVKPIMCQEQKYY